WGKLSPSGRSFAFGQGHILRGATELVLLGTRGRMPRRQTRAAKSVRSLLGGVDLLDARGAMIVAPLREHSRKPEQLHEAIETLYPGPYCELFARTDRPGWDCTGDQLGKFR